MNCRATVLLPVYNGEKFLGEAIESILNQTYSDFIFIIINDGSTDNSEQIINSYKDKRVRYFKNQENIGLIGTLNKGLALAVTEYIIRMDADDIAMPYRIEEQIRYMDHYKNIGVSCGYTELFGKEKGIIKTPLLCDEIKARLLFENCIAHPTVIIRRKVLFENNLLYSYNYKHIEDYDLWLKLQLSTNFGCIDKVLCKYRITGNNISKQYEYHSLFNLYKFYLNRFGYEANEQEIKFHIGFRISKLELTKSNYEIYRNWLNKLLAMNERIKLYNHFALKNEIERKWNELFFFVHNRGLTYLWDYYLVRKKISWAQLVYIGKCFCKLKLISENSPLKD